jgi:tRNA threonylcarbamoyladenosine biosynthesis protein TsaB
LQRDSAYELATPEDLLGEIDAAGESVVVAGDGALRFRALFDLHDLCEVAGPSFAAPSLSALVELGASRFEREDFAAAADVVPMYLRRSDAEISHDRRPA